MQKRKKPLQGVKKGHPLEKGHISSSRLGGTIMMDPPNKLPNSLQKDRLIPTRAREVPNAIEGTHKEELNLSQIGESLTNMRQNNTLQHYFN